MSDYTLITGASGLLGSNWVYFRSLKNKLIAQVRHKKIADQSIINLSDDLQNVDRILQVWKPEIRTVIHAAGLTNIEACEKDSSRAYAENTEVSKNIALVSKKMGARLVHISTDHIFSGNSALSTEITTPEPINLYAKSKLNAEIAVQKIYPEALIVRTNLYGWGHHYRHSFTDWIITQLRSKNEVHMYNDVYFTPIYTRHLIEAIEELVRLDLSGVYHVVGDQRISKYEFGLRVAEKFKLDKSLIRVASYAQKVDAVRRPLDMSLDNTKTRAALGRSLGSIDDGLNALYLDEETGAAGYIRELVTTADGGGK